MERVILWRLTSPHGQLDNLQFASKAQRGTEDATLRLVHMVTKHIQHPEAYARILFIDFSSAFITIRTFK